MDLLSDLTIEKFLEDTHAARYRDQLESSPAAFRAVLRIVNDPANEQRLIDAEAHGLPALAGVARFLEVDPVVMPALAGPHANRFKQTVGVIIRIKMERLGWRTTGRKGPVRGSSYFTKAERFTRERNERRDDYRARALSLLDQLGEMGSDAERATTGRALQEALAGTRAAEGRPF